MDANISIQPSLLPAYKGEASLWHRGFDQFAAALSAAISTLSAQDQRILYSYMGIRPKLALDLRSACGQPELTILNVLDTQGMLVCPGPVGLICLGKHRVREPQAQGIVLSEGIIIRHDFSSKQLEIVDMRHLLIGKESSKIGPVPEQEGPYERGEMNRGFLILNPHAPTKNTGESDALYRKDTSFPGCDHHIANRDGDVIRIGNFGEDRVYVFVPKTTPLEYYYQDSFASYRLSPAALEDTILRPVDISKPPHGVRNQVEKIVEGSKDIGLNLFQDPLKPELSFSLSTRGVMCGLVYFSGFNPSDDKVMAVEKLLQTQFGDRLEKPKTVEKFMNQAPHGAGLVVRANNLQELAQIWQFFLVLSRRDVSS